MFNEGITESDMSIKHVREVLSKYEHETMELLKDSNYIFYHTLAKIKMFIIFFATKKAVIKLKTKILLQLLFYFISLSNSSNKASTNLSSATLFITSPLRKLILRLFHQRYQYQHHELHLGHLQHNP